LAAAGQNHYGIPPGQPGQGTTRNYERRYPRDDSRTASEEAPAVPRWGRLSRPSPRTRPTSPSPGSQETRTVGLGHCLWTVPRRAGGVIRVQEVKLRARSRIIPATPASRPAPTREAEQSRWRPVLPRPADGSALPPPGD